MVKRIGPSTEPCSTPYNNLLMDFVLFWTYPKSVSEIPFWVCRKVLQWLSWYPVWLKSTMFLGKKVAQFCPYWDMNSISPEVSSQQGLITLSRAACSGCNHVTSQLSDHKTPNKSFWYRQLGASNSEHLSFGSFRNDTYVYTNDSEWHSILKPMTWLVRWWLGFLCTNINWSQWEHGLPLGVVRPWGEESIEPVRNIL